MPEDEIGTMIADLATHLHQDLGHGQPKMNADESEDERPVMRLSPPLLGSVTP